MQKRLFKSCKYSIVAALCIILFANKVKAQTYVTAPISATPAAGAYYNNNSITLAPGFSFTASAGQTFQAYIGAPDCLPFAPVYSQAQNYIVTSVPRIGGVTTNAQLAALNSSCQVMKTVQYFDGLGRPLQTVQVMGSPLNKDLVLPNAYDVLGREATKYLPYSTVSGTPGSYKADALQAGSGQAQFYSNPGPGITANAYPYSITAFESSPLDRVNEQGAPGASWQLSTSGVTGSGQTVKAAYGVNVANIIINWTVNPTGGATGTTFYPANTLYTVTGTDEQGNNTIQYKDMQGRLICKRVQNTGNSYLSTYYIYDDFNQLAYVIPPIPAGNTYPASFTETDQVFLNFIYGYHYDARHRQVEKKIPGKGWKYAVYNNIDKIVATQDAVQRAKTTQEWSFIKYDELGRTIITGVYQYSGSSPNTNYRAALQTTLNGQGYLWETPTTTGTGYSSNAWPASWTGSTLGINYYDNYTKIPTLPSQFGGPTGYNQSVRTVPTASLTNVIGTSNMLWTVSYYDGLGRIMKAYKQHYFGGVLSLNNYDVVLPSYNFTNAVTANTRQHYINNTGNTLLLNATIANTYVYDHEGRKIQTFEQINGGTNVMLSQIVYNEVRQQYQKQLHSEDNGNNFIEKVIYSFNERGWLTETNSANFDEKLYYNNPSGYIAGLTGLYNGNILEAWYNSPNVVNKSFAYTYDSMNRLTSSKYYASGTYNGALDETASYDYLGNITQMVRGSYGAQAFVYSGTFAYTSYTGSQVNTITNNGTAYRSYTYDPNGNTVTAGNYTYDYNMLNLPNDVKSNGTIFNTYTFDSNGQKLRKVSTASGYTTDYIDGIQYKNGTIDFIQTEEGRYEMSGSSVYQYELKDHLGNVRVIIQKNTATTAIAQQETEYYAFGLNAVKTDNNTNNKYLYNSKEWQDENALNQYDYGARLYDPIIARWNGIDPLAENSRRWSPYNYVENSPVRLVDPDGMSSGDPNSYDNDDEDKEESAFNSFVEENHNKMEQAAEKEKQAQADATEMQKLLKAAAQGKAEGEKDAKALYDKIMARAAGAGYTMTLSGGITDQYFNMNVIVAVDGVNATGLQTIQTVILTKRIDGQIFGKLTWEINGVRYWGLVDGGPNSPWITVDHNAPIFEGKPYRKNAFFIGMDQDTWFGTKGIIHINDDPGAVPYSYSVTFESIIVAINYNGTGKDKLLGSYQWGWDNYGTVPMNGWFTISYQVSPMAIAILKFDYPDYDFY